MPVRGPRRWSLETDPPDLMGRDPVPAADPVGVVNAFEAADARCYRRWRCWDAHPTAAGWAAYRAACRDYEAARRALIASLAPGVVRVVGRRSYERTPAGLVVRPVETAVVA